MNKYLNIIICIFYLLFFSFPAFSQVLLRDEFVEETLAGKELPSDKININYNYEDLECIPIKLKIDKKLSTKELLQEGDTIVFRIRQDVKQDRKIILRKDTIVTAKIEAFLSRGMNGIPGQIIIDNFEVPGIDAKKLKSTYIKKGLNLTLFVLPIKWALTPIPFVGSLTNLIIGGHANINPRDTVTLYYYPNWHN